MHAVGGFVMMYHLRLQELGILDSQAAVDAHHLTGLNTTAHGERLDVLWNSPALLIEMLQCVLRVSNQPSACRPPSDPRRLRAACHGTTPFAHTPPLPLYRCVLLAVCVPAYMGREYAAQFWRNSGANLAQLFREATRPLRYYIQYKYKEEKRQRMQILQNMQRDTLAAVR